MSDTDAQQEFDVFLSYNGKERATVERIAERLKRAEIEPWFDKWCLTPGGDWQDELADGLRRSAACAVFIGACGLGNWERLELKLATQRMAQDRNFHVFLVLLPGLPEPFDTSTLPPFLSTRTWVDLRKGIADSRAFQTLINAVKHVAPGPETPIAPRNDVCPYRGLRAFDERHAEFFFGREGDVQRLIEKLKATRFLAVLGPSGSGKTSVVRAGLLPALQKGAVPESDTWSIRVFTPGAHPLTSLAANLVRLCPQLFTVKLLNELRADQRALNMATSVAQPDLSQSQYLVWVVDQFEEVFSLCQDEAERIKFIDNLLYAATVPGGRNVVVLTMRADFYQKCATYPELSALVAAHQFLVSPLSMDGLRRAVAEPAWRVGLEFEPGLIETILGDMGQQPGALPMLEHALLELWERRRGQLLTLQDYRETGGVASAIAKRAEAIFESLDAERQSIAQRVFLRLTQPGDGTEDTRRRATFSELVMSPDEAEKVRGVVEVLINARLLTMSNDPASGPEMVDVAHEALIRNWPRLKCWVDEDRQGLRTHHQLTEAAQEWRRSGHDEGLLFRGARLAQTMEWGERSHAALNELEKEFLSASAELQTRERMAAQRRTRRIVIGLIITLVLISAASLIALNQSRLAKQRGTEAFARELAANALTQLRGNAELSLLLAVEAAKKARIAETENTLRQVLARSPAHVLHLSASGATAGPTATFSRDGKLVVATNEKTLWVFDVESGQMLFERQYDLLIDNAVISPDGRFIASALTDSYDDEEKPNASAKGISMVQIAEASTGRDVIRLQTPAPGADLIFSPDARFLVTPGEQSQVWEVGTWRTVAVVAGREPAFSRDGRVLLTKSANHGNKLFVTEVASWKRVAEIPTALEGNVAQQKRVATPFTAFEGSDKPVFGALSPDGERVVASTDDRRVRLYQSGSGRMIRELKLNETEGASVPQFSPDGQSVAFAVHAKGIIWDTSSGETRDWSELPKQIYGLSFNPDGRLLLTVSTSAQLHDLRSGTVLAGFSATGSGAVSAAEFSPDGKSFLTTNNDGTIYVGHLDFWRARTIQETSGNTPKTIVASAAFSPDCQLVATITMTPREQYVGQVWELGSGHLVWSLPHERDLTGIAFSPDGKLLLTTDDVAAQVWELGSKQLLFELRHGEGLTGAVYSRDGKLVATTGKGMLKIWTVSSGQIIEEIPYAVTDTDAPAIFTPDSKHLLITTAGQTHILEIDGTHAIQEVGGQHDTPTSVEAVYSPNGRYILMWERLSGLFTTSSIQVRDADTDRSVVELRGHVGSVFSATFDPSGQYILTTSGDTEDEGDRPPDGANETRVWDLSTGSTFYEFGDQRAPVLVGAFAPDGKSILVIDGFGTVFSYFCELCVSQDELLRLAQQRSVRQLTPDERARYLHESPRD